MIRSMPQWRWPDQLSILRTRFLSAAPYPHLILDGVFPDETLRNIFAQIPDHNSNTWTRWGAGEIEACTATNSKRGISSLMLLSRDIAEFLQELNRERFLTDLRCITDEPSLSGDHTFNGGGIHCTGRGGRLRVHADRVRHPRPFEFDQRINLILFLNPHWRPDYGGELELWSRDRRQKVVAITPAFNRLVLFQSDAQTYHGHPAPTSCPDGEFRTSIATYYYIPRHSPPDALWKNEIDWADPS